MNDINGLNKRLLGAIYSLKRTLLPPASRREEVWIEFIQLVRLYLRDGFPGILHWIKIRIRGGKLLVPVWWLTSDRIEENWLETWLQNRELGKGEVILYSALPFDENTGQRATWLAKTFAEMGYQVLITGWRWSPNEKFLPITPQESIVQASLDSFWQLSDRILSAPIDESRQRLFLIEFPHPSLFNLVTTANMNGWVSVYDCIDDWEEFHHIGQATWYEREFEIYLANNVHCLTATSQPLIKKIEDRAHRSVCFLPNAYRGNSFSDPPEPLIHEEGTITIGYFGHLTPAWFNWDVLIKLAYSQPDWAIHLIGYGGEEYVNQLPENIHYHGKISHHLLPSYTANWDVGIIPFKINTLSQAVDPIKLYEYLALRLPVVSLGMPHLSEIPSVWDSVLEEDFEKQIVLAAKTPFQIEAVAAYLQENTWEKRAEKLEILLIEARNAG